MAKAKPKPALQVALRAEPINGLGWGLYIQRYSEPRHWRREFEKVPAQHRAGAEEYLKGCAARLRTLRARARADGFDSVEKWRKWRIER